MQIHNLKRKTKNKKSQLVARGGKRGKTAGRGTKGQKARAGHKIRPEIRDMIKRLPKLRGRGVNSNKSIQTKPVIVHVSDLSVFKAGETVSPFTLIEKGIISLAAGRHPKVKILGFAGGVSGKGDKVSVAAVTVSGCTVSASVKAAIEKAGGKIEA